jgi:hypothetical protein
MKAEQEKDFRDKSVIDVNPSPLYIGGVDSYDEEYGYGCLFMMIIMIMLIIICGYVAIQR